MSKVYKCSKCSSRFIPLDPRVIKACPYCGKRQVYTIDVPPIIIHPMKVKMSQMLKGQLGKVKEEIDDCLDVIIDTILTE